MGDPALSKLSRGVWGGLFVLSPLAYWLAAGLSVALYVGAYILGDASIHTRLSVCICMVYYLLMPAYTVPI